MTSGTNGTNEHIDPFDEAATSGIGLPIDGEAVEEIPDADETEVPKGKKPRIVSPAEGVRFLPLRKDLKKAAEDMTIGEVRFAVDGYYTWQGNRIAAGNQAAALTRTGEPNLAIVYVQTAFKSFELDMAAMLDYYTKIEPTGMGIWMRSIMGVGPVLAAGLLAHLDITKAPTTGHFWRFAGYDPTVKWLGTKGAADLVDKVLNGEKVVTADHLAVLAAETHRRLEVIDRMAVDKETGKYSITTLKKSLARRPWNASLKVLCWKLGESFVKVANYERDYYGKEILVRKAYEQAKNERGDYAEQAAFKLANFNIGKGTTAYKFYAEGKLPPGHIHARAKRHAVKLFLSHLHDEMYRRYYQEEPPKPYPIAFMGHTHYKPAPVV